ncbi:MAG: AraC family transcriptional regulator [Treponema sp.]|jgi:AraC-like DNA-binding protein|nr:AraC family transcriptional regulator [Treponema sp.]
MKYLICNNADALIHVSSGQLLNQKNFIHERRNLDTFVIIICMKGTLYIAQDENRFTLNENQFIILFADHEHYGYRRYGDYLSYYWCHFRVQGDRFRIIETDEVRSILERKSTAPKWEGGNNLSNYYTLPEYGRISSDGRAILIVRQLLDLARNNCYSEQLPNYALSLLAMEISQELIDIHSEKNLELNPKMEKIIEWIRVNYNLRINMRKIARNFFYSPDYLSTAFRKYTGYPLMKYITMVRIANAKKLLLNTGEGIKEIAYKVGFDDEKAFMKRFKQFEDVTPTTYRNAFSRVKIVNR